MVGERRLVGKRSRSTIQDRATSAGPVYRLESLRVESLFGLYTYDVSIRGGLDAGPSLLLLYGDNGSGKTTILQLIYHLLGKEDDRGHRTFLARTPFRRLIVTLDPGVIVEAFRSGSELVGEYRLRIETPTQTVDARAPVDADMAVVSEMRSPAERRDWNRFVHVLGQLNLRFFFLRDDRRSDPDDLRDNNLDFSTTVTADEFIRFVPTRVHADVEDRLQVIITELETWVRDEALRGASLGEEGTRDLYADLIKRIADSTVPGRNARVDSATFIKDLLDLELRSAQFVELGLVSAPQLGEIARTFGGSPSATHNLMVRVISPYADSLRARLDAQQQLMELITLFLKRLNQFLRDKSVSYELSQGFTITGSGGNILHPDQLSSGERQLFALLAQVIKARSSATVFLIDEPEISLNVKWQRVLVDTLLQLVRGASVQFILATHSLELLASHRDFVARLGAPLQDG